MLQDALEWLQQRGEIRHLGLSATVWQSVEEDDDAADEAAIFNSDNGSMSEFDSTCAGLPVDMITHSVLPGGLLDLEFGSEEAGDAKEDVDIKQVSGVIAVVTPEIGGAGTLQPDLRFPGTGHLLNGTMPIVPNDADRLSPPTSISLPTISFPTYAYSSASAAEYAPLIQFSLDEGLAARLVELFESTLRSLAIHRVNGDSSLSHSALRSAIAKCRWLQRLDLLDCDALCPMWVEATAQHNTAALMDLSIVNCSRLDGPALTDLLHQHAESLQTLSLVDLGRPQAASAHGVDNFPELLLELQTSADSTTLSPVESPQSVTVARAFDTRAFELPNLREVSIEADHCEFGDLSFLERFADAQCCPAIRKINISAAPQLNIRGLTALLDSSCFNAALSRRVQPFEQLYEFNFADEAFPYASEQDLGGLRAALARRGIASSSLS